MNPIIDRLASKMEMVAKSSELVEAMSFYGSFATNQHDFYSDLDVFIYLEETHAPSMREELKERIREIIRDDDQGVSHEFEIYSKWIIFTEKNFIKIEIDIKSISKAKDDVIYILESRVSNVNDAIAYDKNNKLSEIYEQNAFKLNEPKRLRDHFIQESYKFFYYFEGYLSNMAKEDEYRAYMNYTIAFYKLAGLKAMVEGEFFNLFQPKRFTTEFITDWTLRTRYYKASAGLRKYNMLDQRDNIILLFTDVFKKGITKFEISEIFLVIFEKLLSKFNEKYLPFKNCRDVSLIINAYSNNIKLKEGLIYRCASLSKNDEKLILKFMEERNVNYIIDLRNKKELENYIKYINFYSPKFREKYVKNVPISTEVNVYMPNQPYLNFYYAFLMDFKDIFKELFETHFASIDKNRIMIHCEGGKDRTGVIVAILLDLLGIDRDLILEDYLLSYSDTKPEYIEFIFETIDKEFGSTEKFLLEHCNVSNHAINMIKTILVEKT